MTVTSTRNLPYLSSSLSHTEYRSIFTRCKPKKKLVLHFDINETILLGDDAGGDSVHDCLNKIITKSAFVRVDHSSHDLSLNVTKHLKPTRWCNGDVIGVRNAQLNGDIIPPPPLHVEWEWPSNCCPYYRTALKRCAKTFIHSDDGKVFYPVYNQLLSSMLQYSPDHGLSESHPFYRMMTSFFYTLTKLTEFNVEYSLVFRTFGTDMSDVSLALNDFANGKHPLFSNFCDPKMSLMTTNIFRGRYRRALEDQNHSIYDLWDLNGNIVASGDDEVLELIEGINVCGIQDDYQYWDENSNLPSCGKPLWIHPSSHEHGHYHLFFDDNIHNDQQMGLFLSEQNQQVKIVGVPSVANKPYWNMIDAFFECRQWQYCWKMIFSYPK